MDLNWMCEAYRQVRKNAATGIDGQTVAQYGENLVENLRDLQTRAKSGSYQAPPVKRAYVPKNEKEDRPIGIPTTEDKILQRAVSMILGPIYEQEFLPFSFGPTGAITASGAGIPERTVLCAEGAMGP